VRNDPEILPKITALSEQYGIDPAAVIAILAINALAVADFASLSFWAEASNYLNRISRPN
jgi:hypothetical protein